MKFFNHNLELQMKIRRGEWRLSIAIADKLEIISN